MNTPDHNPGAPSAAADAARIVALAAEHPDQLLVSQLSLIDDVVAIVVRRHRLSPQDRDDFCSIVRLRLIENDYAVLRQFRGQSSLRTYLLVVITRLVLDYTNAEWGKWRASSQARRLGLTAVRLERAIWRDQLSVDAACASLAAAGIRLTPSEASTMLERIPSRTPRRHIPADHLDSVPAKGAAPDAELWSQAGRIALTMLQSAVMRLGAAERRLLKLRFRDRVSVADVARRYGVDQKALYRRFDGILGRLRVDLESQGVRAYR